MLKRNTDCGVLRDTDSGRDVILNGWVHRWRDHGGVVFIDVRDRTGLVQIVFRPEEGTELHERAHKLRSEFAIAVRGEVQARSQETVNPNMDTGAIEVVVREMEVLNTCEPLPYQLHDSGDEIGEIHRLKYRYLDLRSESMQNNMRIRHQISTAIRNYLDQHGFWEIETPILTRSTPEGARDFLVPSRMHDQGFYALPQSPQLYKQLLMVGGTERYYQVARCFRDEDLRADRQPEFTQIDLEMSFVDETDVMSIADGFVRKVFREVGGFDVPDEFPRMTYDDAMEQFGTDAPDLRIPYRMWTVTDVFQASDFKVFRSVAEGGGAIKVLKVAGGATLSRKQIDDLTDFVGEFGAKGLAWIKHQGAEGWQSPIVKFFSDSEQAAIAERTEFAEGDIVFFGAGEASVVNDYMSRLRSQVARELELPLTGLKFCWIVDFPLFLRDSNAKRLAAVHHPFTAPMDDQWDLLDSEPLQMKSRAYDLVLNGTEIGGGSIRIHNKDRQIQVFRALGIPDGEWQEKFGFLLDALAFGAPPHGGIAFGLDRMVMLLAGADSIRETIAFPKTQRGQDLVMNAPSEVDTEQLLELGLRAIQTTPES